MTPARIERLGDYLPRPEAYAAGEAALLPALVRWLLSTRRLGVQTRLAYEVPWLGRRVDLALLTGRGMATAFELKVGRLQRAIEQAAYNRASFHRSWVVTANWPKETGLRWASDLGIGLLVVRDGEISPLSPPAVHRPHPDVAKRLRLAIAARASAER